MFNKEVHTLPRVLEQGLLPVVLGQVRGCPILDLFLTTANNWIWNNMVVSRRYLVACLSVDCR